MFGILEQSDFNVCLKKIEEEKIEKMIDFVGSVPCLSQISKGGVTKIVKSLKRKKFVKN